MLSVVDSAFKMNGQWQKRAAKTLHLIIKIHQKGRGSEVQEADTAGYKIVQPVYGVG